MMRYVLPRQTPIDDFLSFFLFLVKNILRCRLRYCLQRFFIHALQTVSGKERSFSKTSLIIVKLLEAYIFIRTKDHPTLVTHSLIK